MMALIILMGLLLVLPLLAVMIFVMWSIGANELNRLPTKEEWKEGKRERKWL